MRGVLADGSEIELTAVDGGYAGHLRDGFASWRETGQPCYADWPILLLVDGKALWAKPAYPSDTNPDFGVAEPVAALPTVRGDSVAVLADGTSVPIACFSAGYFHHSDVTGTRMWSLSGSADGDYFDIVSIDGQAVAEFDAGGYPRRVGLVSKETADAIGVRARGNPDLLAASPPTGTSRRREILERIASCVCRDRQNNYGDAEDNFKNIADYWTLWLRQRGLLAAGKEVDALDVAQMSAFIKVARKVGNLGYLDNWVDGGGYEVCGAGIVLSREGSKP